MHVVWLLIVTLYQLDAMSPIISVPGIASEAECHRLAEQIKGPRSPVKCVSYEVQN